VTNFIVRCNTFSHLDNIFWVILYKHTKVIICLNQDLLHNNFIIVRLIDLFVYLWP